jgi:phage terminase small subunit
VKKTGIHQRRTRFIKEYLIDQNATRAAIAAGYSEKTGYSQGQRLLKNVEIRSQIESENSKINQKLEVSVERVREELARLAFYDPAAFWNKDGSAKPITDIDPDTVRALAGFEMAELYEGNGDERSQVGYVKKFKLADKGLNLERLGRHLKMFTDKVEVSGMDVLADALAKARQRAS